MTESHTKSMRSFVVLQAVALIMVMASAVAAKAAEYVVVANKGVSTSSLSKDAAEAIFLGDKTKWDDGKAIRIAVLEGSPAAKAFLGKVVGKSPAQFDNYWKKQVFTGKAAAPKTFDDADGLIQFVSGTSGAVGFVGAGEAGSSVKTISIK